MLNNRRQHADSDRKIFFPWERRGGVFRAFRLKRLRPFLWAAASVMLLAVIWVRERRATGIRITQTTMAALSRSLDLYLADHNGQCPRRFGQLGPYRREKGDPVDAWGKPLRLTCPSPNGLLPYHLMSDGPDRLPGGLDRIE